ncbi:MAG: hypothetical protein PHT33_09010 [bacterium]|nr:hypothetical protein [bacterium]
MGYTIIDIIQPAVSRVIDILRATYGQYWLREFEKWDSRENSLGSYCSSYLQMKWSLDDGAHWKDFIPGEKIIYGIAVLHTDYSEYLDYNDWLELQKLIDDKYEPSLATHLVAQANNLMEHCNFEFALVTAVTAFEIAVEEYLRKAWEDKGANEEISSLISAINKLSLINKVDLICVSLNDVSLDCIEHAKKAISKRNKVVHEGLRLPRTTDTKDKLRGLISVIDALLGLPKLRHPLANAGNAIGLPKQWKGKKLSLPPTSGST